MDIAKASRSSDKSRGLGPGNHDRAVSYFSLTAGGALLALRLRDEFGGIAHLPQCHSMGCVNCDPFENIAEALPASFLAGDTIVCVMAAGIVFRILAPHLRSKYEDPAVIVIDEEGGHVIPLLGGHAAGANRFARGLASFLGCNAAITTSSDVQGLIAPDEVAAQLGAAVADQDELRKVTALVVDGRPVCIEATSDSGIEGYDWVEPGGSLEGYDGRLLLTHLNVTEGCDEGLVTTARLIPRAVAAGIGCKRGASGEEIIKAVSEACSEAGIDMRAIASLSSIDKKKDEVGLGEAARRLGVPLNYFSAAELAALERPGNSFVNHAVGTPAVSEPAAMLAAGDSPELVLEKIKHGPVTVALALSGRHAASGVSSGERSVAVAGQTTSSGNSLSSKNGEVLVVGTGAGVESLMTAEAIEAISSADIVLGYRTYTRQLRKIFPGKEFIEGSMGAEIQRCQDALDFAASGKRVAMVSSGDPGVYGMAGPLLEMSGEVRVSIIPGVTAAQIAAARLGAPLMNDYITLSLSDLLTPREDVLGRAGAAAGSDMVVCLYNPTSRKRQPLFEAVCALFVIHRPLTTPVGWVRDAGGPDEDSAIIDLIDLSRQEIDMRTIVIIGNSSTEVLDGRMITRRGYDRKNS